MREFTTCLLALAACGIDHRAATDLTDTRFVRDERVAVPLPRPEYYDIVTPDIVIDRGTEKMFCLHVTAPHDLTVDGFVGLQGPTGHHIALHTTTQPREAGTLEECTSSAANRALTWFVVTTGLPTGKAIFIPAGMELVLQIHYVNASDDPILVRDVGRVHLTDPAAVKTWIHTAVTQSFSLELEPGASRASWECVVAADQQLLAMFGHMHEYGTRYSLDIGTTSGIRNVYLIEAWDPSLVHSPPLKEFYDSPLALPAGTVLRTTCDWLNTTSRVIQYPEEMCLTFAYVSGGDHTPCSAGGQL